MLMRMLLEQKIVLVEMEVLHMSAWLRPLMSRRQSTVLLSACHEIHLLWAHQLSSYGADLVFCSACLPLLSSICQCSLRFVLFELALRRLAV